jgi:hypothetical protein
MQVRTQELRSPTRAHIVTVFSLPKDTLKLMQCCRRRRDATDLSNCDWRFAIKERIYEGSVVDRSGAIHEGTRIFGDDIHATWPCAGARRGSDRR